MEHEPLLTVHLNVTVDPAVMPVTVVVGDAVFVMVALPASIVHTPAPGAGAFPVRVKVDALHCSISLPASATGGVALFVSTTSSELTHDPFVIVHRRVTELPALREVTVVPGNVLSVIVAPFAAPTMVHKPVPVTAVFPASVKSATLHCSWSGPALATVAGALFVSTTSSNVEHEPLLIVHRNVTVDPTGTPVTVVVGDPVFVMVAAPDCTVHNPVPSPAALAARVNVELLQSS